jgi:proteasome lid subunit RPN8/RPN11
MAREDAVERISIVVRAPASIMAIARAMRDGSAPNEACAILFGHILQGNGIELDGEATTKIYDVISVRETPSIQPSPYAFTIDPLAMYRLIEDEANLDMIGYLHTHPGRQFVSATDETYMRNASRLVDACWLIAGKSGKGLEIGAYVVAGDRIIDVPIEYT